MDGTPGSQNSIPPRPLRHQTSYENMSGVSFPGSFQEDDESDHQYDELHAHDRRRNRPNAAPNNSGYRSNRNRPPRTNSTKASEAANETTGTCEGSGMDTSTKVFRILAFVGFSFALAVFLAVVFLAAGVLSPPNCHDCSNDLVPSSGRASKLTQELLLEIKELSSNISELNVVVKRKDQIISQLQTQDVKLYSKIAELERKTRNRVVVVNDTKYNYSSLIGAQGPQGFDGTVGEKGGDGLNGKDGKRGVGNMTSCRFMRQEGLPFTAEDSGIGQKLIVTEDAGYKILGVACSTMGSAEYNFKSEFNSTTNVRGLVCECRGKSEVFQAKSEQAKCIMNYWVCPLTVS